MTNDKLNNLIQSIGLLTELWSITYQGFKRQGMSDSDAMQHTKAFMSGMFDSFLEFSDKESENDKSGS